MRVGNLWVLGDGEAIGRGCGGGGVIAFGFWFCEIFNESFGSDPRREARVRRG